MLLLLLLLCCCCCCCYSCYSSIRTHTYSFPTIEISDLNDNDDKFDDLFVDWRYNGLGDLWADWLDKSSLASFKRHGFYTLSVIPGRFRIVVLNNNFCYMLNL